MNTPLALLGVGTALVAGGAGTAAVLTGPRRSSTMDIQLDGYGHDRIVSHTSTIPTSMNAALAGTLGLTGAASLGLIGKEALDALAGTRMGTMSGPAKLLGAIAAGGLAASMVTAGAASSRPTDVSYNVFDKDMKLLGPGEQHKFGYGGVEIRLKQP